MSIAVTIDDQATPTVDAVLASLDPARLTPVLGKGLTILTKKHLRKLNNTRANHLGGRRTNFYASAADGTTWRANTDGFTVSINQRGFAQRLFGGVIRPTTKKALTIPVHKDAYAKKAREFDDLVYIKTGRDKAVLVKREPGQAFGVVYYLLLKKVTQKADPTVLPKDEDYKSAAVRTARAFIRRQIERGGAR